MLTVARKQQVQTYEYLPKQKEFMDNCDSARYSAYIGGFGSGKTHVLVQQVMREGSHMYTRGLIGAPTYKMLEDTTNLQASEIAKVIYEVNYETSIKNFQSLFEQMRKLFPLERSLPGSAKDTITDLETSLERPLEKEDLQEGN